MIENRYSQTDYYSWNANGENDTYINPVLYVDYSDPDAIRVGDDYFMVASSFCNAPGLPLLHSTDLVNWKLINYCIKAVPGEQYSKPLHGCGVWAPAIRYYNGEFIVFFPMPDEGIYVVKTKDPWGEWDEPYCLISTKGWIDPCPFWDEDGRAYMVNAFAKSRIGFKSILQVVEMTPDCTELIGEPKYVFDGNVEDEETIEGPKLYKRNGYYYIFAPAGGVKQGWQTVLRSKNIYGPYEKKRVCMQMDTKTNGPHQGAWVDTVTGEDWFLHFQDVYAAGRIVHLQPMTWNADWPVIGVPSEADEAVGKPVIQYKKPNVNNNINIKNDSDVFFDHINNDDLFNGKLKLQWQWNANPEKSFIDFEDKGIVLNAIEKRTDSISNIPNLLIQKWTLPEFTAKTCLDTSRMAIGDVAGMISLGVEYRAVAVRKNIDALEIIEIGGTQKFQNERASAQDYIKVLNRLSLDTKEIFFINQVEQQEAVEENTDGPFIFKIPRESITLMYSTDDKEYKKLDSYEAKAGRWVGVKHGIFAYNEEKQCDGKAGFAYYKYISKK